MQALHISNDSNGDQHTSYNMLPTCDTSATWYNILRSAPEDLAKERGAVMEELRMSNNSNGD